MRGRSIKIIIFPRLQHIFPQIYSDALDDSSELRLTGSISFSGCETETLPSRFENIPPAFKYQSKKKVKKAKKLPTYCVFCKVRVPAGCFLVLIFEVFLFCRTTMRARQSTPPMF